MAVIRVALGNAPRHCVAVAGCLALVGCAPAPATQNDAGADIDAAGPPAIDADTPSADAPIGVPDASLATPDAAPDPDAASSDPDAGAGPDGGVIAHRHTIAIDGVNDFDGATESFGTTSASYGAFVTWDDDHLYVGYSGDDVDSGDANKWLLVHIDVDPGAGTGATAGEVYNTQQPGFPAGFGAEHYVRWRASDDLHGMLSFSGGAWAASGATITTARVGTYVELKIPLSAFGPTTRLGVASLMLNETPFAEGAYAGLYADSFTDGYYDAAATPIPATAYLDVDLTSAAAPNAAINRKP